jgi:hypothetical protein
VHCGRGDTHYGEVSINDHTKRERGKESEGDVLIELDSPYNLMQLPELHCNYCSEVKIRKKWFYLILVLIKLWLPTFSAAAEV